MSESYRAVLEYSLFWYNLVILYNYVGNPYGYHSISQINRDTFQ